VFPVWEWKVGWSVSGLRHWAGMGISCSLLAGLRIEEEGDADGSGEEHGAFLCITQVLNSSCSSQESFGIRCCRMTALLCFAYSRTHSCFGSDLRRYCSGKREHLARFSREVRYLPQYGAKVLTTRAEIWVWVWVWAKEGAGAAGLRPWAIVDDTISPARAVAAMFSYSFC
jgi:hypothetical protein